MRHGKLAQADSSWTWRCFHFLLPYLCWTGVVDVALFSDSVREYWNRIPFDSATWKSEESMNWSNPVRLRMVDDLMRKHKLVGRTKVEINELLGLPAKTGYFSSYDYVYWLGPERSFIGIDSEWLAIRFKDGRVTNADIVTD